uniref:Uncharacterized protein n=1 Tax=Anguilla anguilla TaxID=7936 RepID=A0A0E9XR53_ANGAN
MCHLSWATKFFLGCVLSHWGLSWLNVSHLESQV